jgi:uncharacterized protein (TIGR01777 family)
MNVLLTGGTGFIGGVLVERLVQRGDSVVIYTRDRSHFDSKNIMYINSLDEIPEEKYFECFINLAGESMAQGRWSEERKAVLLESRVGTTRALVALARRLRQPPAVVLSASAIGYYGHHGDEFLSEDAPPQEGFSHRLCQAWENEALRFEELGSRVCLFRLGVVLGPSVPGQGGGALAELSKTFRFGIGTWLGSGRQWLSWVHRDDVLAAMEFLLEHGELAGAFNLTAPEPVTNKGFCIALRHHLRAVACLPVPGPVLRLALGEMADELLLKGQRVVPRRLLEAGFDFRYNSLAEALPDLLAR